MIRHPELFKTFNVRLAGPRFHRQGFVSFNVSSRKKLGKHFREKIWRKSVPSNIQSIGKLEDKKKEKRKKIESETYPKRNKKKKNCNDPSISSNEYLSFSTILPLSFLFSFPFFCRAKRFSPIVSARCSIDPFKPDFYEVVSRRTGFQTSGFATSPSRGKSGCENVSVRVVRLDLRDPGSTIVANVRAFNRPIMARNLFRVELLFSRSGTRRANRPKDALFSPDTTFTCSLFFFLRLFFPLHNLDVIAITCYRGGGEENSRRN